MLVHLINRTKDTIVTSEEAILWSKNDASNIFEWIDCFKLSKWINILITNVTLKHFGELNEIKNKEINQKLISRNSLVWLIRKSKIKQYRFGELELNLSETKPGNNDIDVVLNEFTNIAKIGLACMELKLTNFKSEKYYETHE